MKIAIRGSVFETNSSSSHTLTLISKKEYEFDKKQQPSKYRSYGIITDKYDKLLMACGCCEELFTKELDLERFAGWGDEFWINRKKNYDGLKNALENGRGDTFCIDNGYLYYELAIGFIVRVYCELTNENYDKVYAKVDKINNSGRACHMKFFSEGALDDEQWDYRLIYDMFDNTETDVLNAIRYYFDDDVVLCYRENYAGLRQFDDDD